jgi:hypothetical protein
MNIGKLDYDGSLIHSRFAYTYYRDQYVPTGNIVSFRGKMNVTTNLIDKEDLLNNDFIFSQDAVNFCWEIPNMCAFGGVAFQRLFCTYTANILFNIINKSIQDSSKLISFTVIGDDIMVLVGENTYQKASVSISTRKDGAVLGHLGINIVAGNRAPQFAYSTNLSDEQVEEFIKAVESTFFDITRSMFIATTKTV